MSPARAMASGAAHGYPHRGVIARRARCCKIAVSAAMRLINGLYSLARPMLFQLDAETAHRMTLAMLSTWPALAPRADPPELRVRLWDVDFPNPVGLAAGMDKDAIAVGAWQTLGFGFAELGTITPRAQPGNPRPRIFRIPERRALINRLGFPSEGMEAVARRIEALRRRGLTIKLGLNFGPNKETAVEGAAVDCAALMARMGRLGDFVVINVSSPNTPGLRNWQSPERIRAIVEAIADAGALGARRPPLLLKVAPDLDAADLDRICGAALDLGVAGIVATNTTLAREQVGVSSRETGGLSGRPLLERSREVIRAIRIRTRGRIPIIGVGGIASADDAWEHICAGASLVEIYTGLVYEGPGLAESIKAGIVRLMRRDGFRSITEAVGTAAR
jgi:dihydroorotate dehydrogenase